MSVAPSVSSVPSVELESWAESMPRRLPVPSAVVMGSQRLVQVPLTGPDGGRAQRQQPVALPGRR